MTATYIYDAVRISFGRAAGALSDVRSHDLTAHAEVEEVYDAEIVQATGTVQYHGMRPRTSS